MENPVLVEVTRGDYVESVHRGAISIVDSKGKELVAIGDVERPVFPRSAIKPLQALYLVESGAVDGFNLSASDIALSCASHSGEAVHTKGVSIMLDKAGLSATCLECGSQWPTSTEERAVIMKAGEKPVALHNNCSGKHAGFICASHHLGEKVEGYIKPEHPAQRETKGILENLYDFNLDNQAQTGTDGCSIPTYAVPLKNLALAFAKFAAKNTGSAGRDQAIGQIHEACVSHPNLVAGTKRFDTVIMEAFGEAVLVKTGAEGVYAGSVPSLGLGIALKCEDGTTRASEAMMAACLAALLDKRPASLERYLNLELKNRNGWKVGCVKPVDGLLETLRDAVA